MIEQWFKNRLKSIMNYLGYKEEELTVEGAAKYNHWTPTDLIIRETLNNGGDSAKKFLNMTKAQCLKCFDYIADNKPELISLNWINKDGCNNSGFPLWKDYRF